MEDKIKEIANNLLKEWGTDKYGVEVISYQEGINRGYENNLFATNAKWSFLNGKNIILFNGALVTANKNEIAPSLYHEFKHSEFHSIHNQLLLERKNDSNLIMAFQIISEIYAEKECFKKFTTELDKKWASFNSYPPDELSSCLLNKISSVENKNEWLKGIFYFVNYSAYLFEKTGRGIPLSPRDMNSKLLIWILDNIICANGIDLKDPKHIEHLYNKLQEFAIVKKEGHWFFA